MEETVRTFEPELQIEIKSKISGLVTEYEFKNLKKQTSTIPTIQPSFHHQPQAQPLFQPQSQPIFQPQLQQQQPLFQGYMNPDSQNFT